MSMNATVRSSSWTSVAGTSPATILQNRQSGSAAIAAAGYLNTLKEPWSRTSTACAPPSSTSRASTAPPPPRASGRRRSGSAASSRRSGSPPGRGGAGGRLDVAAARAALGGGVLAALGGRRTAPLGLLAAAGIVDDVSGGPHLFRRLLPHRPTYNVTGTAGDPDAEETLVFVAHHDAANGGLIFRPELTRLVADTFPGWYERQSTSAQMLRLVAAGPALAGLGGAARVGRCCAASARSSPPAARSPSSTSARAPSCRARTTTSPRSP